jgi:hypothetical protein
VLQPAFGTRDRARIEERPRMGLVVSDASGTRKKRGRVRGPWPGVIDGDRVGDCRVPFSVAFSVG